LLQNAENSSQQIQLEEAIDRARIEDYQTIGSQTSEEKCSYKLIHHHVKPPKYTKWTLRYASNYIRDELYRQFQRSQRDKLYQFLQYIRSAAGLRVNLFESAAHNILSAGGTYSIRNLHTKHEDHLRLSIKGKNVINRIEELKTITVDTYIIPAAKNFACIDALCIDAHCNTTYLFQMTVSKVHPIPLHNLNNLLNFLGEDIKLFFVVPTDIFSQFGLQKYTVNKKKAKGLPLKSIEQYVLCIDLSTNK